MLQFTAVGRLTKDPEMKFTPTGTAVTNFTVAVDTGFGEKKVTAWLRLSCFAGMAETANKYLVKGKQIFFVAEYQPDKETGNPRTYVGSDNEFRSSLEAKMTHMQFVGGKVESARVETMDDANGDDTFPWEDE